MFKKLWVRILAIVLVGLMALSAAYVAIATIVEIML